MNKYFFSSLTRISDLAEEGFSVRHRAKGEWVGDYVVGEVVSRPGALSRVELRSGRMIELVKEDLVVGAFGIRGATLEAVGSWEDIGPEQRFHAMTSAGLFGRVTSLAPLMPPLLTLDYRGHCLRQGRKLVMNDFVRPIPHVGYDAPPC